MIIDWNINTTEEQSVIFQDFGQSVYDCLNRNIEVIKKYKEFTFFYPSFTYHPKDASDYCNKFCMDHNLKYKVIFDYEEMKLKKGDLYFLVSDRTLARFLDQCSDLGFEPGNEVGVISYNETPMKKYVKNGISVISTDFELMGKKAAEFVSTGKPVRFEVPTRIKIRSSI